MDALTGSASSSSSVGGPPESKETVGGRAWCASRRRLLQRARAALHLASMPAELLCREVQLQQVRTFCRDRLRATRGVPSLYVSGNPGLGKSLTIRQAYERLSDELPGRHRLAFLNAFHLASPSAVYARCSPSSARKASMVVRRSHRRVLRSRRFCT